MPRYDFVCPECEHVIERRLSLRDFVENFPSECPTHGPRQFELVVRPPAVEDWGNCSEGRFFEHLAPQGMRFRDRRSYQEHLKRNGLQEWAPRRGMPGQVV